MPGETVFAVIYIGEKYTLKGFYGVLKECKT